MKFIKLIATAILSAAIVGCSSINPATGQREYDPVTTEQVKAALQGVTVIGLGEVLRKKPESAEYIRSVGSIFCRMKETKVFSVDYLVDEANKATLEYQNGVDPLVLASKDSLIALYRVFLSKKGTAELPETEWPYHVADLFCESINTALINAGAPGVK
jgi:hypothetical protein